MCCSTTNALTEPDIHSALMHPKICQFAKILSVADVYDALVTKRPYKDALSQRDAVEMLMSMTNQLDFIIVTVRTGIEPVFPP